MSEGAVSTAPAAAARVEEREAAAQKTLIRDYAETILICVIFVIFSRAFVFQQSKIPSGSMMDTLLVGDYIMVNRFVYAPVSFEWERRLLPTRELQRGDIVVFKQPDEPETDYIKRVAGLPGDTVEVRQGFLLVNGKVVNEPWVRRDYRGGSPQRPIKVQPGHYFMLGDHRNASSDSRSWGLVPRDMIKGRALLIWYSFAEPDSDLAYPGLGERVRAWAYKTRHFVTGTRWNRCFTVIR